MRGRTFLALLACGLGGLASDGGLPGLVGRLGDPSFKVRADAYERILALGSEDPDRVLEALPREARDPEMRDSCARLRREIPAAHARSRLLSLGKGDPALAAAIGEILACPSIPSAKGLLAAAGPRREIAGEVLVHFVDHPEGVVRHELLRILLDLELPSLAPKVARFLAHEETEVRLSALGLLAEMGNPDLAAAVVPLLRDPAPGVRRAAADVFCRLGGGREARELVPLFSDPEVSVRAGALETAARTGDAAMAGEIARCLADPEAPVRASAIRALDALDARGFAGRVARCLEEWSPEEDEEALVPEAAVAALGRFGDPETAPALARFLGSSIEGSSDSADWIFTDEPPLRARAAVALCRMGDRKGLPRILDLLSDPNPVVRRAVAEALPDLADLSCVAPLVGLHGDPDPEVAAAAAEALARLADALPPRPSPATR